MICEYVVRFENEDLVCFLIVERVNFIELERFPVACVGCIEECAEQIDACQRVAEEDWGRSLPWAFSDDPGESRVCWTGRMPMLSIQVGLN